MFLYILFLNIINWNFTTNIFPISCLEMSAQATIFQYGIYQSHKVNKRGQVSNKSEG